MKLLKWLGIVAAVYVTFVFVFEGFVLGYLQPNSVPDDLKDRVEVIVLRTADSSGAVSRRRVAGFEMDGKLYASAHHRAEDLVQDLTPSLPSRCRPLDPAGSP